MALTTRERLRLMADDQPVYFQDKATGDDRGTAFFLSHFPIHPNAGTAGTVWVDGVLQTATTHYTLSWQHGRLVFTTAPPSGAEQNVQVDYLAATFTDDEIDDAYVYAGGSANLEQAAAELWRIKAGRSAAHYSFRDGGVSFDRSDWHKACMAMAEQYDKRAKVKVATAGAWVSGVSVADKETVEADSDRVGARFRRGQFDNPGAVDSVTDLAADD